MKDIYQHPTIKDLAASFAESAPASAPLPVALPARNSSASTRSETAVPTTPEPTARASTGQYVLCGTLQLLIFLGYTTAFLTIMGKGYPWVADVTGLLDIYLRALLFGGALFVGLSLLPIAAKWILIGRWKPQRIRIWSLNYVRFWLVKTLIRANPLALLAVGSPLYLLYLRALGARVGKGVAVFSTAIPVCTDLLSIGDDTVIRKGASLSCYRAHDGVIEIGSVTLGRAVVVSEATVLDIETSMGDGAQLGHSSSLHSGQAVPAGERWHGSPARRTEIDYQWVPPTRCGTLRRVLYPLLQLLSALFVWLPLGIGGAVVLVQNVPLIPAVLDGAHLSPTTWTFYLEALVWSLALMFSGLVIGLLLVASVPRLLNRGIRPGKVYALYGLTYAVHAVIQRMTNIKFFTHLFGDSSYIVGYLSYIGWNLNKVEQTGSNFGTMVGHDNPYLSSVGSGTMVADGLLMNNADYSATSFRLSQTTIGAHSFLGNYVIYPSQGKTGENCLLATKVMVPVDGKLREGVGLLGSPSFEIPRSVQRDTSVDVTSTDERRRRLSAKNRHNLVTMGLFLLVRWFHVYVLTMLAMIVTDVYRALGPAGLVVPLIASLLFSMAYFILVERASTGFRRLRPQYCSIYDPYFWWHERFWKLSLFPFDRLLVGTPFKGVFLRLLGVRIGKKVFDDGCAMPEKTLVTIGDHCTINAGTMIQCHSQEDGAFKSDAIVLGSGCTVGIGAVVHYGVSMGDGSVLAPDSFLMKGEQVPPHAYWGGNPAEEMPGKSSGLVLSSRVISSRAPSDESWSWDLSAAAFATPATQKNGHGTPRALEAWSWDLSAVRSEASPAMNGHVSQFHRWGGDPAEDRQENASNVMVRSRPTPRSSTEETWSWW